MYDSVLSQQLVKDLCSTGVLEKRTIEPKVYPVYLKDSMFYETKETAMQEHHQVLVLEKEQLVQHPMQENFPYNRSHVKALIQNWDPLAVGVLIVSFRYNKYRVLDGRHRWESAPAGFKFECKVLYGLSEQREAELWHSYNIVRKTKTAIIRHHNDVMRRDPEALAVDRLISSIGREVKNKSSTSNNVACVNTIKRMLKKHDLSILESVFPLLGELTINKPFRDNIVAGMIELESRSETSLTTPRWKKRILDVGYNALDHAISSTGKKSGGHERIWAQAILEQINYKLPKDRRLKARGIND